MGQRPLEAADHAAGGGALGSVFAGPFGSLAGALGAFTGFLGSLAGAIGRVVTARGGILAGAFGAFARLLGAVARIGGPLPRAFRLLHRAIPHHLVGIGALQPDHAGLGERACGDQENGQNELHAEWTIAPQTG